MVLFFVFARISLTTINHGIINYDSYLVAGGSKKSLNKRNNVLEFWLDDLWRGCGLGCTCCILSSFWFYFSMSMLFSFLLSRGFLFLQFAAKAQTFFH